MTALQYTLTDSVTMLRRNLIHAIRYPVFLYMIGVPVVVLLLFVYAFGGTLGAGLPGGGDTSAYLTYVVPGIVFLAVGSGGQLAAISVSQDMTEGIIARFRTMDISRSAVLAGHVLGNTLQLFLAVGRDDRAGRRDRLPGDRGRRGLAGRPRVHPPGHLCPHLAVRRHGHAG